MTAQQQPVLSVDSPADMLSAVYILQTVDNTEANSLAHELIAAWHFRHLCPDDLRQAAIRANEHLAPLGLSFELDGEGLS